jgi:hypothetical protein
VASTMLNKEALIGYFTDPFVEKDGMVLPLNRLDLFLMLCCLVGLAFAVFPLTDSVTRSHITMAVSGAFGFLVALYLSKHKKTILAGICVWIASRFAFGLFAREREWWVFAGLLFFGGATYLLVRSINRDIRQ